MTLIQKYNSLTRENQIKLKEFWMQKTGLSSTAFYRHFRFPNENDIAICDLFFSNYINKNTK